MSDYPDHNLPYPFYFNGTELPKWSAQWHLVPLDRLFNDFTDSPATGWDEFVGYQHIWHLQCRIDHVGWIDSEDPGIFHVCAQEVLRVMLLNRDQVVQSIGGIDTKGESGSEVYLQIVEGIAKMLALCARDGCAFWTSGYEEDRLRVEEWVKRSALPPSHSEYLEPPHVRQRRSEQIRRAGSQLSELRRLAQQGTLNKRLRQLVNQLPELTDDAWG